MDYGVIIKDEDAMGRSPLQSQDVDESDFASSEEINRD